MKIMGLDYGTVRVGVAISYASLAQPLLILANDEQLLPKIIQLAREHHVTQIVVGISENKMARLTKKFVARLENVVEVPVTMIDETLSSHQVEEWLQDISPSRRRQSIDHYAAAVILQNYLDYGAADLIKADEALLNSQ